MPESETSHDFLIAQAPILRHNKIGATGCQCQSLMEIQIVSNRRSKINSFKENVEYRRRFNRSGGDGATGRAPPTIAQQALVESTDLVTALATTYISDGPYRYYIPGLHGAGPLLSRTGSESGKP